MNEHRLILSFHKMRSRLSEDKIRYHRRRAKRIEDGSWLDKREQLKKTLEECSVDGKVAVYYWGRDCDLSESDGVYWIAANVPAYVQLRNRFERDAEGPWNMWVLEPKDAEGVKPYVRDRAAEMMGY